MDRRSFLKTSALGGSAAAATTLAAPAYAQGNRTLTLVTTWGRGLAGVHDNVPVLRRRDSPPDDRRLTDLDLKAAGSLSVASTSSTPVSPAGAECLTCRYYFLGQHPR